MPGRASTIFIFALLLFCTNQLIEGAGFFLPALHSYLDDLLCLPIVLTVILAVQRRFVLRTAAYTLPFSHTLLAVVLYGVLFEIILPHFFRRGTADALDWLLYAAGGLIFHLRINLPASRQKSHPEYSEVAF